MRQSLAPQSAHLNLKALALSMVSLLAGCGAGSGEATAGLASATPIPTASAAVSTTASVPAPSPSPTTTTAPVSPSPTSTVAATSRTPTVVAEGDSLSIFWSGNYTGMYAAAYPNVKVIGKAVGGSGVNDMTARIDAVIALKPDVVTFLIGANDLGPPPWIDRLFSYAERLRAAGIKVAAGTVLPWCSPNYPAATASFAANRPIANAQIRASVGSKIDAVIDFAADPVIGTDAAGCDQTKYGDGVHPTAATQTRMSEIYARDLNALLARL